MSQPAAAPDDRCAATGLGLGPIRVQLLRLLETPPLDFCVFTFPRGHLDVAGVLVEVRGFLMQLNCATVR